MCEGTARVILFFSQYNNSQVKYFLYVMGGKKYFTAVFLAPHDPSVIIHVMFPCSIDNTRKGIGNGNEIMYFSCALPVLCAHFWQVTMAVIINVAALWDFCGCYR